MISKDKYGAVAGGYIADIPAEQFLAYDIHGAVPAHNRAGERVWSGESLHVCSCSGENELAGGCASRGPVPVPVNTWLRRSMTLAALQPGYGRDRAVALSDQNCQCSKGMQ